MISWQKVLINALIEHDAIGVRATASTHLGHEPTRAQITAARRAAHVAGAADLGRAVQVPVRLGDTAREINHLVLVRFDTTAEHDQLLDTATCRPPTPIRGLELNLTALEAAVRNIEVDQLSADQAGYLAARLRAAVADLTRLSPNLERQAKRR